MYLNKVDFPVGEIAHNLLTAPGVKLFLKCGDFNFQIKIWQIKAIVRPKKVPEYMQVYLFKCIGQSDIKRNVIIIHDLKDDLPF